ncbi:MAG: hypothetical protein PHW69_04845, partial [Elusimicrobiaceae bacterium]|nr:hypothetical protein [Elusimicrobiaceae bacterium]
LSLGYETELHISSGTNATKIIRGKGGLKLYQGANIKDLYLAAVLEQDYTYSPNRSKYAWEAGFALEQNPAPNLRLKYSGLYRNFFRTSNEKATDYLYELALNASAEIDLWANLKFAPYASLYQARGKFVSSAGRNVKYGLSLKYSFIYKPFIH